MVEQSPYGGTPLPEHGPTVGPEPLLAGWFRFYFANEGEERWEWSPETARIHGYEPGTVTPTTDLVMSHKHPEDLRTWPVDGRRRLAAPEDAGRTSTQHAADARRSASGTGSSACVDIVTTHF